MLVKSMGDASYSAPEGATKDKPADPYPALVPQGGTPRDFVSSSLSKKNFLLCALCAFAVQKFFSDDSGRAEEHRGSNRNHQ